MNAKFKDQQSCIDTREKLSPMAVETLRMANRLRLNLKMFSALSDSEEGSLQVLLMDFVRKNYVRRFGEG